MFHKFGTPEWIYIYKTNLKKILSYSGFKNIQLIKGYTWRVQINSMNNKLCETPIFWKAIKIVSLLWSI